MSEPMIKDLPRFMRNSRIYNAVFDAETIQFDSESDALEDIRLQMDVNTATWGLRIFEDEYDIPTDLSKPLEERRSVIRSKMRGSGVVDRTLLKIVADSYTNGDAEVTFNGVITIQFTSGIGRPPNLDEVKRAIQDVKPAHLPVEYVFRYLTIGELSELTIGEVSELTIDVFAGGA